MRLTREEARKVQKDEGASLCVGSISPISVSRDHLRHTPHRTPASRLLASRRRAATSRLVRQSSPLHPRLKRPLIRPTRARGGLLRAREADGALVLGGSGPDTGVIRVKSSFRLVVCCFISRLDLRMEKVSAYRPPVSRIEKGSVESTHKGVPTEPRVLHVPFSTNNHDGARRSCELLS